MTKPFRALKSKRAVIQWNLDHPKLLNKKRNKVVAAYEKAKFSVLRLEKNLKYGGIKATNIITKEQCLLIDRALNASRKEGCFFVCSLLNMGSYFMTSGGGIPIDPFSSGGKSALTLLKKHLVKLRKTKTAFNDDIIKSVREFYGFCLRAGTLKYMTIK